MNPILALSYPEFVVAEELAGFLPKTKGFAIAAPMSSQNQGWDLLIYSKTMNGSDHSGAATVQVKASKAFPRTPREKERGFGDWFFWYNKFKYATGAADLYVIVGHFPRQEERISRVAARRQWQSSLLLFTDAEMAEFIAAVPGRFFGFDMNSDDRHIFLETPIRDECYEAFRLENRKPELLKWMTSESAMKKLVPIAGHRQVTVRRKAAG